MTMLLLNRCRVPTNQTLCRGFLLCIFLSLAYSLISGVPMLKYFESKLSPSNTFINNDNVKQRCIQAKLDMYPSQKFKDFFYDTKKVKCSGQDWVITEGGVFKILQTAKDLHGPITCDFLPIVRGHKDGEYYKGDLIKNIQDGANVTSDVAWVNCTAKKARYSNYHLSVQYVKDVHQRMTEETDGGLGMNVLMFGFDSVSRLSWQRKLPKSYAYMRDVLKCVVLEGYNTLGDGTPAALLPMLTGKTEEELPEARKGFEGAQPVDGHPWIWKDFKRAGYVTHFTEDSAETGVVSLRMLGFKSQPTDHFIRHFYVELEKKIKNRYCLGSEYKHTVLLNYLKDFETVYRNKRKFSFGFHGELSHSSNAPLNIADDELKQWLETLLKDGLLDNTVLILMSDHGARFQYLRDTLQGKLEERNPFFSLRVPPWFTDKYPVAYKNLLTNSKRLTTPFDIHQTFHDILDFRNISRDTQTPLKRGIGLFSKIPAGRTCTHAQVPPHWCNCLEWTTVNKDSAEVKKAADAFINLVNSLTEHVRSECDIIEIDKIVKARVMKPNNMLLKYKGIIKGSESFSDKTSANIQYQLIIRTKPGAGHFEATVENDVAKGNFTGDINAISRTNAYGSDPECVMLKFPHLVRFCHCKKMK